MKKTRKSGPLLGFGICGYLDTPSVLPHPPSMDDSTRSRSLTRRSRSSSDSSSLIATRSRSELSLLSTAPDTDLSVPDIFYRMNTDVDSVSPTKQPSSLSTTSKGKRSTLKSLLEGDRAFSNRSRNRRSGSRSGSGLRSGSGSKEGMIHRLRQLFGDGIGHRRNQQRRQREGGGAEGGMKIRRDNQPLPPQAPTSSASDQRKRAVARLNQFLTTTSTLETTKITTANQGGRGHVSPTRRRKSGASGYDHQSQRTTKTHSATTPVPNKRTGGVPPQPQRTSEIPGVSSATLAFAPSATCSLSTECAHWMKEDLWPIHYRSYQFVYVFILNGTHIVGGINKSKEYWWFQEPLSFPATGLPANMLIPVRDTEWNELQRHLQSLTTTGQSSVRPQWNMLGPWDSYGPELRPMLLQWWKQLTNECVGQICAMNDVLDPLTGRCLSRMLLLEPVKSTGFEDLPLWAAASKSKIASPASPASPSSSLSTGASKRVVLDDATRAHQKWIKLRHYLLYETRYGSKPEVQLLGVVYKPPGQSFQSTAQLFLFPYPIPIEHRYEFNESVFGLPEPYLQILVSLLRKASRSTSSVENIRVLTATQANQILLAMQKDMGEFIVIPNSCLFEASLSRPGAYIIRDSVCHEVTTTGTVDTESSISITQKPSTTFAAYIAERDARFPGQVNVIAGFNSHMQLILPETPISVPIDVASQWSSKPIDISSLQRPFVYDYIETHTIEKLSNSDFFRHLGHPSPSNSHVLFSVVSQ